MIGWKKRRADETPSDNSDARFISVDAPNRFGDNVPVTGATGYIEPPEPLAGIPAPLQPEPLRLYALEGEHQNKVWDIDHMDGIGRISMNRIVLRDPRVSRIHCEFFRDTQENWCVRCMGRNGMRINHMACDITGSQSYPLASHDRIYILDEVFEVIIG